ncbi:MAG: hypothetical protein HGA19_08040 [Oscillochloris sp.]|nr:hypothetical protein [Oscillochloris sp.]
MTADQYLLADELATTYTNGGVPYAPRAVC